MNDRAKAAQRVMRLRAQMSDLAEWRRLRSDQRAAAAEAARADLERFAADTPPTGELGRAVLAQAARIAHRQKLAGEAQERDAAAAQAAQRQLKTAEAVAARLSAAAREARERRDLERLIEQFAAGQDPASLP